MKSSISNVSRVVKVGADTFKSSLRSNGRVTWDWIAFIRLFMWISFIFGIRESRCKKPSFFNRIDQFIWPYVLNMSRKDFRVNAHSIVALNVKELLARNRRDIWSLSDCNGTRTHNHLVCKRTTFHRNLVDKDAFSVWNFFCVKNRFKEFIICSFVVFVYCKGIGSIVQNLFSPL